MQSGKQTNCNKLNKLKFYQIMEKSVNTSKANTIVKIVVTIALVPLMIHWDAMGYLVIGTPLLIWWSNGNKANK